MELLLLLLCNLIDLQENSIPILFRGDQEPYPGLSSDGIEVRIGRNLFVAFPGPVCIRYGKPDCA